MIRSVKVNVLALLLAASFCMSGTDALANDPVPSPTQSPAVAKPNPALDEILQASNKYFSGFPFMRAEDVYEKVVKGEDKSFLIVSVQPAEEYARGHVPGAVNIPFQQIAEPASVARLPRDKKLIFTCEDGHRSMAAALFFSQLGYETHAISMGLSYWNRTGASLASPYPGSAGYPVSTVEAFSPSRYELPALDSSNSSGPQGFIQRTRAVLAKGRSLFIDRSEVYEKAVKGGDKNYVLVSLQRPEDYTRGHVPGAMNIPYSEIAKADSLRKLPRDKKIVLICYVGHWAASAALFLNQLGYEAYDMRFGTLGWHDGTDGLGEAKGYLVSLSRSLSLPVERSEP